MTTLDTLCVRLEAEAGDVFGTLDTLETRLAALRGQDNRPISLPADIEMRLTVAADDAVSAALAGAGETLSAAVASHDVQLASALASAQQALADALTAAVNRLTASLSVTVPVYIDSTRVAGAVVGNVKQRMMTAGKSLIR